MLQDIRNNFQGTFAKIVIAIICIPFVLFGVESLFGGGAGNKVAEVNGDAITVQELNEAIYLRKKQLLAQMGDRIDPAMLDDQRLAGPVLESLVDRRVNLLTAEEQGFAISDAQINAVISNSPEFQEDGVFSQDRFNQLLQASGLSSITFKSLYHSDLLLNQFANGVASSAFLTDADSAASARFTHETRDLRFIQLSLENAQKSIKLSEDEVKAYYDANKENFKSEEKVSIEYISLQQSDFVKTPSDEEVKAAYDDEVAAISQEPIREVAHILVDPSQYDSAADKDAKIAEIQASLDAGEAFAEVAKRLSDDFGSKEQGGFLGMLSVDIFPEAFVAAASELDQSEVSLPVVTESGTHFIQVVSFSQADVPSFEERKAEIAENLQAANAEPAFWAAVEELKDVSFNAPDLSEPAEILGVEVQSSGFFSRDSADEFLSLPAIQDKAFSAELINDGVNSEVIELASDHIVVLRITEHQPSVIQELSLVQSDVKQALLADKTAKQLNQKAEQIVADMHSGKSVELVAKSNKLEWQLALAMKRSGTEVNSEVVQAAFSSGSIPEGQRLLDTLSLSNGDAVIFEVSNVQAGKLEDVALFERNMLQNYLAQSKGVQEFQSLRQQAREAADIEIFRQ